MCKISASIKVDIFKVTGLRKMLLDVDQICRGTVALSIRETWMKSEGDPASAKLDGIINAPVSHICVREYGGDGTVASALVIYELLDKYSSAAVQYITILIRMTSLTTMYMRPRAQCRDETEAR